MEDSIIKIKLVLEDKSEKQTDISVPSSCLNIRVRFRVRIKYFQVRILTIFDYLYWSIKFLVYFN